MGVSVPVVVPQVRQVELGVLVALPLVGLIPGHGVLGGVDHARDEGY